MTQYPPGSIHYSRLDLNSLRNSGYHPVDMHLHTRYSDGLTRIPELLSYARKHQIGVAITDHNEIKGALEAVSSQKELLIIPGIELETREGPHLLIYFSSPGDLKEYFHEVQAEKSRQSPDPLWNLTVAQCLMLAEGYHCLRVAAHPYGYFGINRGVLKCVEKQMLPGVLNHLDGIEVICGGMTRKLNQRAITYAQDHKMPFTGGSDAHLLSDVGSVVTAAPAHSAEEFLESIRKRENVVVGKSADLSRKGATASVIAWSFVPYTGSLIGQQLTTQQHRIRDIVTRYKERCSACRNLHKK